MREAARGSRAGSPSASTRAAARWRSRGWAEATEIGAVDLARRFEDAGVAAIVYTDIERDGLLKGLNVAATLELANAVSIPVIASGGLASLADVERLLEPDCAILDGAIAGRALYDGRLDPRRRWR